MEVVNKSTPSRIPIEQDMGETEHVAGLLGDDGVLVPDRRSESFPPNFDSFRHDVAIEVCIEVGAPRVPPPTFGVEPADGISIIFRCLPVVGPSRAALIQHLYLHIDPGIATVPEGSVGRRSWGQVPSSVEIVPSSYRFGPPDCCWNNIGGQLGRSVHLREKGEANSPSRTSSQQSNLILIPFGNRELMGAGFPYAGSGLLMPIATSCGAHRSDQAGRDEFSRAFGY
jgi:hypothetical protein